MTVFVCWVPLSLFCSLEVVDSYLAFATLLLCISTVSRESPDTLGEFPAFAFPGAKLPLLYKCHTAARKWLHVSGLCPLGWDVQCFLGAARQRHNQKRKQEGKQQEGEENLAA